MTAQFWEYDSRLGRRWNRDPVEKADQSTYACFDNNPILLSDPNGAVPGCDGCPKPTGPGTVEGQTKTTESGDMSDPGEPAGQNSETWYYHAGGVKSGFNTTSKAGWYTQEEYSKIIAPIARSYNTIVEGNGEYGQTSEQAYKDYIDFAGGRSLASGYTDFLNTEGRALKRQDAVNRSGLISATGGEELLVGGIGLAFNLLKGGLQVGGEYLVTRQLQTLTAEAEESFSTSSLSAAQQRAGQQYPNLLKAYKGSFIDGTVKSQMEAHWLFGRLVKSTPNFIKGPDFISKFSNSWWDITTKTAWERHLTKYSLNYGKGFGIFH